MLIRLSGPRTEIAYASAKRLMKSARLDVELRHALDQGAEISMSPTERKLAEIARLESQFGPLDLGLADALEDFALWYADNRIYSGAEPYFRRSLEIREQKLGADIAVADALERWAKCAARKGKREAEELFQRSLAIREGVLGPMSVDLVPRLDALADRHLRQFRSGLAVSCLRRSLEIVETHGLAPAEVASRLLNIGKLLLADRPAEAELLLRRALAIREELHGPDDAELVVTLDALIRALIAIDRHDDIRPLLAQGLKVRAALLAPAKLLEALEAAIEPLATYGRVEDLTSLLQGGTAATWPGEVKLLLHFAKRLFQQGRKADMNEAVRLAVETLQRIFELGEDDRFDAMFELWPGFSDDDFRQMTEAPDPEDDRLAHALGRIAVGYSMPLPRRLSLIDPDDEEIIEIDDIELSPDDDESDGNEVG